MSTESLQDPPQPTPPAVRDTLFGDMALDQWPPDRSPENFPWSTFAQARQHVEALDFVKAIECWQKILTASNLEARQYLQAWHFLRQHGQNPQPSIAKFILGVVIEVGLTDGFDLLAAYPDHTARYYHVSGGGVVWGRPDPSLDPLIDALLSASVPVVARITPSTQPRPPAPPDGLMRISFLTPSGIHFGQAPMSTFSSDPRGGQVVQAAIELMQALIAKTDKGPGESQS